MPERPLEADWEGAHLDEVFWRGLFDIHLDPLAFVDTRYRIVRANIALAEALGCRTDELVGRNCYEALNGERCEPCPHALLLQDGCPHASELDLARLGGCFWVSVTPVFDDSGQLLGSLHIARNVTAYKKLEAELRAARDEVEARAEARARELGEHLQFQRLLVSLALGLSQSVSDSELMGTIQSVVAAVGELGGFGRCIFWKVADGRARALARFEDADHHMPEIPDEVTLDEVPSVFASVECADVVEELVGGVESCAVGQHPLWAGDAAYAILVSRTVPLASTWQSLLGERLRLLCQIMSDALRRQASVFEAQRLRDDLTRLDQMARLSHLSAALAHELNQPLAATLCNAQAATRLLDEPTPDLDEIRLALDDITASARRAGDVMRQTRALFKGGQQSRHPLNPRALVDGGLKLLRDEIALCNADVVCHFDEVTPTIFGDVVQLQQVLINLVKNALDAVKGMPSGSRRIMIDVTAREADQVSLSVTDTGRGLPEGAEESIFVPFRTDKAEGMGMGLPICRQIVTQHGGTILATRIKSGGTCLTVTLPCQRD